MALIGYAGDTEQGGRARNEDTVACRRLNADRLCVALGDGLGGHGKGEEASAAAVRAILAGWSGAADPAELKALVGRAHRAVLALQSPACRMKTTAAVLALEPGRCAWAYAGDSRIYRFEGGRLAWQSRDHSASQIAVLLGQITPDQIRFHEDRACIYRALGQEGDLEADGGETALPAGDCAFLLCTDGFWEYVLEEEMEQTLAAADSPQAWLAAMRALRRQKAPPNSDNNTAVALWLRAEPEEHREEND